MFMMLSKDPGMDMQTCLDLNWRNFITLNKRGNQIDIFRKHMLWVHISFITVEK